MGCRFRCSWKRPSLTEKAPGSNRVIGVLLPNFITHFYIEHVQGLTGLVGVGAGLENSIAHHELDNFRDALHIIRAYAIAQAPLRVVCVDVGNVRAGSSRGVHIQSFLAGLGAANISRECLEER